MQDVTQLEHLYGVKTTRTLINQCNNQIWLRANDKENAQMAAEALGTHEVEVRCFSKPSQAGRVFHDNESKRGNDSFSVKRETVLNPGEVMGLKHSRDVPGGGAHGYLKISGVPAITVLVWPRRPLTKRFPKIQYARWVYDCGD